jgi:hypothetical protein
MYSTRPGLILGFHGCDQSVADAVINGKTELNFSENTFDWLGNGIYFWEYSYERALDYVGGLLQTSSRSSHIKQPAVIGAIIDLGYCLDLIEYDNLKRLQSFFYSFKKIKEFAGFNIPENKSGGSLTDLLLRDLDCAVIEFLHQSRVDLALKPYDSVKGVFQEGKELYPNAGFKEKNHIQICIRNPNCIKGFFLPRIENEKFPGV